MTQAQKAVAAERFWSKVNKTESCWLWTASRFCGRPYGLFKLNGRNMKAHRVAYMLEYGRIRRGHVLLHACDNPLCVNPSHLNPGTHAENMRDMRRKGRSLAHERQNKARINADIAHEIRTAFRGGTTSANLARLFGIGVSTAKDLIVGRTWVSRVT